MTTIEADYPIYVGDVVGRIEGWIRAQNKHSRVVVLVDSNTHRDCLSVLDFNDVESVAEAEILEVDPGEGSKSVDTLNSLWLALLEQGADRAILLVNLGGGVIGDLGGFLAGTYKRGVDYIHVPTTLLSMVDSSVGAKTGINIGGIKNAVGLFNNPNAVFIDPIFLETLPEREIKSGMAEVLKHALVADASYWKRLSELDWSEEVDWRSIIGHSVRIKWSIVESDRYEGGDRKKLNFGHTIGHALESYSQKWTVPLSHGEAVALGMIMEAYISYRESNLPAEELNDIVATLRSFYELREWTVEDHAILLELMMNDKKNVDGSLRFTLLAEIGNAVIDVPVSTERVLEAFKFYLSLCQH